MTIQPITVELRYFALLREQRGVETEAISISVGTAGALYDDLAARYKFTLPADRIRAAINDRFCALDTLLKEGDRIVFVPPVAGG